MVKRILLMKKIAESVKDEISYSKLHNILKTIGVKISKDIVIDYIGYAKQSFLIFTIKNYFSKFVEKETTPRDYAMNRRAEIKVCFFEEQ